jgi:hypothetical protein
MLNGKDSLDYLRQIIVHELDLEEDVVSIFNQKWKIPTTEGLFVMLECRPSKVISNRNSYQVNLDGSVTEIMDLNMHEEATIGVYSRNTEALLRKEEVVMALYSIYSQQVQEANSFVIFRSAPIIDLSVLEGPALLYRYDIDIILHAWYHKTKTADFYDSFTGRVRANDGQPDLVRDFTQNVS